MGVNYGDRRDHHACSYRWRWSWCVRTDDKWSLNFDLERPVIINSEASLLSRIASTCLYLADSLQKSLPAILPSRHLSSEHLRNTPFGATDSSVETFLVWNNLSSLLVFFFFLVRGLANIRLSDDKAAMTTLETAFSCSPPTGSPSCCIDLAGSKPNRNKQSSVAKATVLIGAKRAILKFAIYSMREREKAVSNRRIARTVKLYGGDEGCSDILMPYTYHYFWA